MALMRLQRLYIRAVEVCRQKFRVFSGKTLSVAHDYYFTLGDNRDKSQDSRE
jgi:hypothetical protein